MSTASVALVPVSAANRAAAESLRVREEQRQFLSTPDLAPLLDDAPNHPEYTPLAVMAAGEVIGFISIGPLDAARRDWWVPLLIVDSAHQSRGLGRAALLAAIDWVRAQAPDAATLGLSCHPANRPALGLYRSLAFEPIGTAEDGELILQVPLRQTTNE